jgi:KDO2-lipid IV(A) lauroyltransferase
MSLTSKLGIAFHANARRMPLPLCGFGAICSPLLHRRRALAGAWDATLPCFPDKSAAERRRMARETFGLVAQSRLDRSWLLACAGRVVARRSRCMARPGNDEIARGANADDPVRAALLRSGCCRATGVDDAHARPSTTIYTTQRIPWWTSGSARAAPLWQRDHLNRVEGIKPIVAGCARGLAVPAATWTSGATKRFVPSWRAGCHSAIAVRFARLGRARWCRWSRAHQGRPYEIEVRGLEGFPTDDADGRHRIDEPAPGGPSTMPSQYYWVHRRFKTRPEGDHRFTEAGPRSASGASISLATKRLKVQIQCVAPAPSLEIELRNVVFEPFEQAWKQGPNRRAPTARRSAPRRW